MTDDIVLHNYTYKVKMFKMIQFTSSTNDMDVMRPLRYLSIGKACGRDIFMPFSMSTLFSGGALSEI